MSGEISMKLNTTLPDIAENHVEFAKALAKGARKSDAYRQYISPTAESSTVWAAASRLAADVKVIAWRNAFKRDLIDELGAKEFYTLKEHLKDLDELAEEAKNAGNYGAAATCKVSQGKAAGLYVNYSEITVKDESVEKLYELLQAESKPVQAEPVQSNEIVH